MNTLENIHFEAAKARLAMESLTLYRNLLDDRAIRTLRSLLAHLDGTTPDLYSAVGLYAGFVSELAVSGFPASLKEYVIQKMLMDENPFTRMAEHMPYPSMEKALAETVKNDLDALQTIASVSSRAVKARIIELCCTAGFQEEAVMRLPAWESNGPKAMYRSEAPAPCHDSILKIFNYSTRWSDSAPYLADFHRQWGSGVFSRHRMLVYERSAGKGGTFQGVVHPDPVALSDFVSYEPERSEVVENTLRFIQGLPANNLLLYGDRGTGKSSTIKAVGNEYFSRGLRIIEVPKKHLADFPAITRQLGGRSLKFILFVDDLAFEDNEENYTALKAALEGGLESKPANVLIYATSNRRHLIKERFSDRAGLLSGNADDEIRSADTMQEKLSLSDRFGMTVVFSSPDKKRYLEIVDGIVEKRGLVVNPDFLHREALKWEMWYNGRSPRTARQFVDWLQGRLHSID